MYFQIYKDKSGDSRWRLCSNGRIIAESGEGYKRKSNCKRMVQQIKDHVNEADVNVLK